MSKNNIKSIFVLFTLITIFSLNSFALNDPTPVIAQPLFLKLGFSSVIEFDEEPEKIILGDSQSFQVEKSNKSLVIRSLVNYASSNLFVYFRKHSTQIFSLTSDEDANPTLLKKIYLNDLVNKAEAPKETKVEAKKKYIESVKLTKKEFSKAKDYLTLDYVITAGNLSKLEPIWKKIRLHCGKAEIPPYKTWSQREVIQKDSEMKARIIFLRPNIGNDLKKCFLDIPAKDRSKNLKLELK